VGTPRRAGEDDNDLEGFFDLSVDLLCIVGFDGYFRRVNASLERTLGYPKAELFSRTVFDITHPDDVQPSREALAQLGEGHDVVGFESRVVCADGSMRWLEWNTRTRPERGVVYGVARDTTERRRADAELRDAQAQLEASRDELRMLADEQAALRRVATLVARETPPEVVFAAVGREVGELLGVDATHMGRFDPDDTVVSVAQWGSYPGVPLGARFPLEGDSVSARVRRTGRPARMNGYGGVPGVIAATVRQTPIRYSIGAPITVEGRPWGVMIASSQGASPFPAETEARLQNFTELVATAISNASAHHRIRALADEQAALGRLAMMVAQGAPAEALFRSVVEEAGTLLGVDAVGLGRAHNGKTVSPLAMWAAEGDDPVVPDRVPIEPGSLTWDVVRTGESARKDDWSRVDSPTGALIRDLGVHSSVGAPIKVEDEVWGVIAVHSKTHVLLPETEQRLERFAALVVTALTAAQSRAEVERLADEQAALRRVATLVAKQTPQGEVFAAVTEEIGRLLAVDSVEMIRYEDDRVAAVVAIWGAMAPAVPIGTRVPLGGRNVTSLVFRTGRAARLDDYGDATGEIAKVATGAGMRSAVATPIHAEGRLWGVMIAASTHDEAPPSDTELRIGQFTELMATAIANAEARTEVARLANEQASLRRVATLVAQGAAPSAVFDAVTREVAELLDVSDVSLARYDDDVLVVGANHGAGFVTVGDRFPLGGENVTSIVLRTGRTARVDDYAQATGEIGTVARDSGVRSAVAAPVVVDGRTWGVLVGTWADREPPPDHTDERLAKFAELLDTAIANADSRDQLTASRARVLAAGDNARKHVVRDLHDGAQQRLVHTIVTLKLAQQAVHEDRADAEALLADAVASAEQATDELRELARGILPTVLTRGGLRAGIGVLVARLPLPVEVEVPRERLPPDLEANAYFIVSEALTNVVKHARATRASVTAALEDGSLTLEVRDDGIGEADPNGHGLVGVADRVDALGGRLRIESRSGSGTVLAARLPLSTRASGEPSGG
jgi:PAS domain S-box-containing protein